MSEQKWIDWHPKVGDIKPERYRFHDGRDWVTGEQSGLRVNATDAAGTRYQIPAPAVTPPEDRPPWIDPQCKFRWGDRVKVLCDSRIGDVGYVINPNDLSYTGYGESGHEVLVARSLGDAVPYETAGNLNRADKWLDNQNIDRLKVEHLELFPEDLPQHFDDTIIDADQPQEQPKPSRVPREIWVNEYPKRWGQVYDTYVDADENQGRESVRVVHFREVL